MSALTENFPCAITIDGREYPIHTDFRNWLKIGEILETSCPGGDGIADLLKLSFIELPPTFDDAVGGIIEFYHGKQEKGGEKGRRIVSFEHDADYIYASFKAEYNIDLSADDLHWHQFLALFRSLSEDSKIVKIMGFRSVDLHQIKSKEQKAYYRRMKEIYKLPDNRTDEQKERDMIAAMLPEFL